MRIALGVIFCAAVACSQSNIPVGSEPSPMEAFAVTPGAHAVWFSEVGSIWWEDPAGRSTVVVTAMAIEAGAQPVQKMLGLNIDLSRGDEHDRIYLDQEAAARTRLALGEIAAGVRKTGPGDGSCFGAKEFWPLYDWPWNKYHELNAQVCGASLELFGRGQRQSFRFPGVTPAQLAGLLDAAIDQLKQH